MANSGYNLSFLSNNPRPTRQANRVSFGAASDADAMAVAAEFGNWTADQQGTLSKVIGSNYRGRGMEYPAGTNFGFTAVLWDSTAGAWRVRFRNIGPAPDLGVILTAILTGAAYTPISLAPIVALSAAPVLPNSGNPVAYVTSLNTIEKP